MLLRAERSDVVIPGLQGGSAYLRLPPRYAQLLDGLMFIIIAKKHI